MLAYLEEQSLRLHELAALVAAVAVGLLGLKDLVARWHWLHPRSGAHAAPRERGPESLGQ